jgi:hypothetical protein
MTLYALVSLGGAAVGIVTMASRHGVWSQETGWPMVLVLWIILAWVLYP